jgi:S-phase kinase-associated protein 1
MSQKILKVVLYDEPEYKGRISTKACLSSELLRDMICPLADDVVDDDISDVPISNVDSETMDKVVEYLEYHVDNPMTTIPKPIPCCDVERIVGKWDADYIDMDVSHPKFTKLTLAANFLNCKPLLDLCMCQLASKIKDKELAEVREILNIRHEIPNEEEKKIRQANPWIFRVPNGSSG